MVKSVIIIEDEKPAARRLQRMLKQENILVDVLLHSVGEAINWLQNNPNPDLIFADIQLSDGLSFEIFEQVKIASAIVFTTAYDQYAINAFKLNSIDYLLKPIKQEELRFALLQFQKQKIENGLDINQLLQSIVSQKEISYKERFSVSFGQHLQSIDVQQIECFYSQDKTTYIFTQNAENFIYEKSLEAIEKQLNPKHFFKVNRKFIVQYQAIKDIISYSNSRLKIVLKNYKEQDIVVARERVKAFKEWLSS